LCQTAIDVADDSRGGDPFGNGVGRRIGGALQTMDLLGAQDGHMGLARGESRAWRRADRNAHGSRVTSDFQPSNFDLTSKTVGGIDLRGCSTDKRAKFRPPKSKALRL
jgi:hypothetical protein